MIPKSDYLKLLGNRIKTIRAAKSLSLRKLSANCELDHSDIAKIEKGFVNITVLTLLELCRGLEIHPKELIDFEIGV